MQIGNQDIQQAFQLAHFLFPDRPTAIQIVIRSLDALEVAAQRQVKRLKHIGKRGKTKVLLDDVQLVQVLICLHADQYQRAQEMTERPFPPSEEQMLVRWFQQLALLSHANSFHAAVGQCRILHRYSTSETRSVYETLMQSADRGKDDDQFRRAKSRLVHALVWRFGERVSLSPPGPRGEENFESMEPVEEPARAFARECQSRMAPWGVSAVRFPADYRAELHEVKQLQSSPDDEDREIALELLRVHTVAHPSPFETLIRGLGMESPDSTLLLPRFSKLMNNDTDRTGPGFREPLELDSEEVAGIETITKTNRRGRAKLRPQVIRVRVNGAEMAQMQVHADEPASVRIPLNPGDTWIEVLGKEDLLVVLLALIFIERDDEGRPAPGKYEVQLGRNSTVKAEIAGNHIRVDYAAPQSAIKKIVGEAAEQVRELMDVGLPMPRATTLRLKISDVKPVQPSSEHFCPNCERVMKADGRAWRCKCGFYVRETA